MTVRPRTAADRPACVEVLAAVYEGSGYPTRWPLDPVGWLGGSRLVGAWVAEVDGSIVGHVGLTSGVDATPLIAATGRSATELAAITRLFVAPAARRGGHAQALLARAVDHARELGLEPVLDVVQTGAAAIALYERLGWRYVASEAATWVDAGGEHPIVRYYLAP